VTETTAHTEPAPLPVSFAPVIALKHGGVVAYRGAASGQTRGLETADLLRIGAAFVAAKVAGKLLVNVDLRLARRGRPGREGIEQILGEVLLAPTQVILEVTRPSGILRAHSLYRAMRDLRAIGFEIAIDDVRHGEVSLNAWSDLQPDVVRVGADVVDALHRDAGRFQFVRLLRHVAQGLGSQVLASEVNGTEELRLLRDLGIDLAEGPVICPLSAIEAARVASGLGAGMGWSTRRSDAATPAADVGARLLATIARPIAASPPQTPLSALEGRFVAQAGLDAIPIVHEGAVQGCVRRWALFARRERRDWERWRERRADEFMDPAPLTLDAQLSLQEACVMLAQGDTRHFASAIAVTERGRYLGMTSAQQLMQELAQAQAQSRRHANPLTGLPGDAPIHEALQSLLNQRVGFVACSAEIAHLKTYNQVFGYARGDNLIKYTAILLQAYCDERLDFLGHESAGQFILVLRRTDWHERLEAVVAQFASGRQAFLEQEDIERGGYYSSDRRGTAVFVPLPEVSLGAVQVEAGSYTSYHQVIEAVRLAGIEAKKLPGSALFVERRRTTHTAPNQGAVPR
jgi:EAL domain-containing protein (putative c-di-GMP-specific phosphodiesterase class I)/GGDEF domain-containing protein